MNKWNQFIKRRNFKKIFIWYLLITVIAGLFCVGWLGYLYRDKIRFALKYEAASDQLQQDSSDSELVKSSLSELAQTSSDILDILLLDRENKVLYSAKQANLAWNGTLYLKKEANSGNFLASPENPDVVFRFAEKHEFMLSSVFAVDFSRIHDEYDADNFYRYNFQDKKVYMLGFMKGDGEGNKVYIISDPIPVKYGMISMKMCAAVLMFFFMLYWVLVALWVYQNALKARLFAAFWGIAALFTNLVGVFIYVFYKRIHSECVFCGAVQAKTNLFCTNCGGKIGINCPSCGHTAQKEDRYCSSCGNEINHGE